MNVSKNKYIFFYSTEYTFLNIYFNIWYHWIALKKLDTKYAIKAYTNYLNWHFT